jgi:DNA-binding NarL/FixJ family response regulator
MTATARPRVAVADDSEVTVAGLAAVMAPFSDRIDLVGAIAIDDPVKGRVDIALYDPFGRNGAGEERLAALVSRRGVARVAAYSLDLDGDAVARALHAGASGYLSKATPARELVDQLELLASDEQVVAGPTGTDGPSRGGWPGRELGLSERESEVVALAALGRRNSEIAKALYVSVDTVKTHLARSFRKLGVHNRTELSALVHRRPSFRRLLPDAG